MLSGNLNKCGFEKLFKKVTGNTELTHLESDFARKLSSYCRKKDFNSVASNVAWVLSVIEELIRITPIIWPQTVSRAQTQTITKTKPSRPTLTVIRQTGLVEFVYSALQHMEPPPSFVLASGERGEGWEKGSSEDSHMMMMMMKIMTEEARLVNVEHSTRFGPAKNLYIDSVLSIVVADRIVADSSNILMRLELRSIYDTN